MKLKNTAQLLALTTAIFSGSTQAAVVDMSFEGLFTWLDDKGGALANDSLPYYDDPTWSYGVRTQISGSLAYDTNAGLGSITVNPFNFLNAGQADISSFEIKYSGTDSLLIGNMNFDWNGSSTTVQIVLDASGLFAELPNLSSGDVLDATTCTASGACATPASNNAGRGNNLIGPTPISTSSFNVAGSNGFGTTLNQLSLGTDDAIGGSPNDNGPFIQYNYNFDLTSLTVTSVPLPAAAWLFGSGLLGLVSLARSRKYSVNENK